MAGDNCCGTGELTCEQRYEISEAEAKEAGECHPPGSAQQHLADFFSPSWAVDLGQLGRQVNEYLICREPCFLGNNAEQVCGPECGEDCAGCTWSSTGCDDPLQCNTYTHGWNYVALARAAEHAGSLKYIPYASELFSGKTVEELLAEPEAVVYVYDKDQIADNQPCDPCADQVVGAYVPVAASELGGGGGVDVRTIMFGLGSEGVSVVPPAEVGVFAVGASNPALGGITVIQADIAAAVGPDGSTENWRIYDVDSGATLETFTVVGNGGAPWGTGVISQSFAFLAPGNYAIEPLSVGSISPSEGITVTIVGVYNQTITMP